MDAAVLKLDEIQNYVAQVAKFYDVKKVSLFGSYASGNQTPQSDIDLLVEFAKKPKSPITLFTIGGIISELEELTGKDVDVVTYPLKTDTFLEIDKEILLYEQK